MTVLAFLSDLMIRSKIEGAARTTGAKLELVPPEVDAGEAVAKSGAALVIVDLGIKGVDSMDLIRAIRARCAVRIIAFGAHVDAVSLEAAHSAGADVALPRSAFFRDLPALLREEGAG